VDLSGEFVREVARLATDAARPQEVTIGGKAYASGPVVNPRQPDPEPRPLVLHTLSGLVDYVKSEMAIDDPEADRIAIHVVDPCLVEVVGRLRGEFRQRTVYARSMPFMPYHGWGAFRAPEDFNVWLMASFVRDETVDAVLRVTGNIREETVRESKDDGVTQVVTARAGIARVAEVAVPNPVTLRPVRTFHEVEQPASLFVLRLQDGPACALFEGDGGAWRNAAIASVGAYLRSALGEAYEVFA
jgi:hypothetical protein